MRLWLLILTLIFRRGRKKKEQDIENSPQKFKMDRKNTVTST